MYLVQIAQSLHLTFAAKAMIKRKNTKHVNMNLSMY